MLEQGKLIHASLYLKNRPTFKTCPEVSISVVKHLKASGPHCCEYLNLCAGGSALLCIHCLLCSVFSCRHFSKSDCVQLVLAPT